MSLILLNAFLYIALLLFYWKKTKIVDCGFLLISVWAIVAVCGVFLYIDDTSIWQLTLQPFLYLFVTFVVYARMYVLPHKGVKRTVEDLAFQKNSVLDVMCIAFIVCALFNLLNSDFSMSAVSVEDIERNAVDNYQDHVESMEEKGYTNIIERITLNYCSWFKVAALIGMYNLLCQRRNGFAYLLGFCIFIPTFITSILNGTRGTLFTEILLLLSAYFLYKKYIPKETKKSLYLIAGILGSLSLVFVLAVTVSRFGDSKMGASDSVLWYFGQSMLYFDYGLADCVNGKLYGLRTFKTLLSFFGMGLPEGFRADFFLGTNFGTNFTTFVGMLILDFGFLGTFIIGIIVPWIINKLCSYNPSYTVASIYLYLFFLNRLILGVFANGSGIDIQYIVALFFYFLFRILFDKKKRIAKPVELSA